MSSKILREIKNINKSVKSITFREQKSTSRYDYNNFNFQVLLDNDKYEFKFNSENNCCEEFGYLTYLGDGKINDIIYNNELLDKNISKILILYKSDDLDRFSSIQQKILIQFIKIDDVLFTIQFYNNHNGYYPHSFIVNLYENNDATPIKIFSTSI